MDNGSYGVGDARDSDKECDGDDDEEVLVSIWLRVSVCDRVILRDVMLGSTTVDVEVVVVKSSVAA